MKWKDLLKRVDGYLITDLIDVSADFEIYLAYAEAIFSEDYTDILLRVTYDDGYSYSEWKSIKEDYYSIFKDDFAQPVSMKVQFKIEFDSNGEATFESLSLKLDGAYRIINTGDLPHKAELWIKKINGSGNVKLINTRNNMEISFNDLNNNETVYIDCDNEDIMSDLPMTYRYNNMEGEFIQLEIGENILIGEGDFELQVRHEFALLQ